MISHLKLFARRTLLRNAMISKYVFRKIYFGLNNIDLLIARELSDEHPYFVELGANDGYTQSNTKHLELYRGWTGVLIEPIPSKFCELITNRSSRNKFYNLACVSDNSSVTSVTMLYSNLQTIMLDGESDIPNRAEHAEIGAGHLDLDEEINVYGFRAPAKTLTSILIDADAPYRMGLLSLDVEGSEMEVLKGLDHATFRFDVICIESRQFQMSKSFLEGVGYKFHRKISNHDYLFIDKNKLNYIQIHQGKKK